MQTNRTILSAVLLSIIAAAIAVSLIRKPSEASHSDGAVANATCSDGVCLLPAPSLSNSECSDGFCQLPETSANEPEITVLSPVPESAVEPIAPAPRLDTLDGKTIALVGGSFMANVTHPELKRLILAEFPTAKVYLLSEIGSAGPYPRPGVVRREKDTFQNKLKEFGVDAVVSGNGGCGLCTPKETAIAVALAARLTFDEARDFLHVAGYALSDSIPADIVYAACFRHRVYERAHVRALLGEFAGT